MHWKKTITMVEAHAEGEVGRIVTSVVNDIPGETMLEKMNYINQVDLRMKASYPMLLVHIFHFYN